MKKKVKWIAVILVCIAGYMYCSTQMNNQEDNFAGDIIVADGTIESIETVPVERSGRYTDDRKVVGLVNIDGTSHEVTLTVNGKPEHSVGEVITCYGYAGEYYISEEAAIRNHVNNGGYFAGMLIFVMIPIVLAIIWLVKRKRMAKTSA